MAVSSRICKKCFQDKPLESFYAHPKSVGGRDTKCSDCVKDMARAWRKNNAGLKSERGLAYREANKDRISLQKKKYAAENSAKLVEKSRLWRLANPGCRAAEYARNVEKNKANSRSRRAANLEAYRARDRAYKKNNAAKVAAINRKRQASKLNRTPSWLSDDQLFSMELIYLCSKEVSLEGGVLMHVDHIVPLLGKNVSGLHVPWNLRIIPAKENLSKGRKY